VTSVPGLAEASRDAYAIVGIGCRFPGACDSPEAFWQFLAEGRDAIAEIPEDRATWMALFDPDPVAAGRLYVRRGGFLKGIDRFDARFFGISPREAARIDPQQRLLLEVVWDAVEDAGISMDNLAGTTTGVFVGISTHDYADMQMYPQHRADIDAHSNTGGATSIAANRISFVYDLRGPSVAVDTACSSALTAVHLACRSLAAGDCQVAIAGGVQLLLNPELTIGFCRATMLSPDCRCAAFDASGNGYVRSEGAGAIVLKPLRIAVEDNDPIYAVILASAINQDGHSAGLTVPSEAAQKAMLQATLTRAGVAPNAVHYVEAHGTGTAVGDPIEASAIGSVCSNGRDPARPCILGSVKTNIGHLEAASGIAGLIKTALAIKHRKIPPSLHFANWNPAIDSERLMLRVPTTLEPWPQTGDPATAAVNSFGFGGANASVLLRAAPDVPDLRHLAGAKTNLVVLSARSAESLAATAGALAEAVHRQPWNLRDIGYTAARRRTHHEHRLAIVADSRDELADTLESAAVSEALANSVTARAIAGAGKLAFVFSGMGPQWWGMGRQLREQEPVFREALERCDAALRPHSGWSLMDEFAADEASSRVAHPLLAQVTNFALQMALAELWSGWGVKPDAVVGHSGGAMAAAYVAGVYSLEDAIRLTYHRSRMQGRDSNRGSMLAVGLPVDQAPEILRGREALVSVAAVNGPASMTLSGDPETLETIAQELLVKGIFARMLAVTIAYHSPKMDPIKDEFLLTMAGLKGSPATIPIVSDTTGDWAQGPECDADYWWRAIRAPVRFSDSIARLIDNGADSFVEISPHPVLSGSITECLGARGSKGLVVPSLRRNEDERRTLLRSLGTLHAHGRKVEWSALYPAGQVVPFPRYPWQRERHWFEPQAAPEESLGTLSPEDNAHPLLLMRPRTAQPVWETPLGGRALEYLENHVIQGSVVFPGAAYVEMALGAAARLSGTVAATLRDVAFHRPFVLADRKHCVAQLLVDPDNNSFHIYGSASTKKPVWTLYATGRLSDAPLVPSAPDEFERARVRCADAQSREAFYARWREHAQYGEAFRGVIGLSTGDGEAFATMGPVPAIETNGYSIHPGLLDAVFQLLAAAAWSQSATDDRLFLPTEIKEICLYQSAGTMLRAHCRLTGRNEDSVTGDFNVVDAAGEPVMKIRGFRARLIESGSQARESLDDWLYEYAWEPRAIAFSTQPPHRRALLPALETSETRRLREIAVSMCEEQGWRLYYEQAERALSDLAAGFAVAAFRELGIPFEPGRSVPRNVFFDLSRGITPKRLPLAKRLTELLIGTGVLRPLGDTWQIGKLPDVTAEAVVAALPDYAGDVSLLCNAGRNLGATLKGASDGRDILLAPTMLQVLEHFYETAPASRFYNGLLASAVEALLARGNEYGCLRILEVGAGTGGTTAFLLPLLPAERTQYVFTDVSPVFLDRARERFGDCPFLITRLFNIDQDPSTQGLELGAFDLIIAANVVHATPDVARTLETLRNLLLPGGTLALIEITRHPYWLDVIFGQTEGWWMFRDIGLRPEHPLLETNQWREVLGRAGFAAVEALQEPDLGPASSEEPAQAVLLAHNPAPVEPLAKGPWLLVGARHGVAEAIAAALEALGHPALFAETDADVATMLDRSATAGPPHGVLHLRSLDAARPASTPPETFRDAQRKGVQSALHLFQEIVRRPAVHDAGLWLVTAGVSRLPGDVGEEDAVLQAPLWGFGRVIVKEHPEIPCRMVDLGLHPEPMEIAALVRELTEHDRDEEVCLRGDVRLVRRLRRVTVDALPRRQRIEMPEQTRWRAEIGTRGSLGSLRRRAIARRPLEADEVEIEVAAASLNYRDVMLAMGNIPGLEAELSFGHQNLGSDCSGKIVGCGPAVTGVRPGDEVLAMAPGAIGSHATTRAALVAQKPTRLGFREAASLPTVFITAWYSLYHLARLRHGESVLIHAATGGVGLAAIQIARDLGAEIFTTAGSPAKRDYLASLGIQHVMDSRSLKFADEIMERTGGRGVDVVLNSLTGEAIAGGLAVLKPYGRFIEIGKRDIYANRGIGLAPFRRNLSYFAVDLDRMCAERPDFVGDMLGEVLDRFEAGRFSPPPHEAFAASAIEDAFRLMAQAKHIGKIVLTFDEPGFSTMPAAECGPAIHGDATYLVTGGLGGFGLALAEWLIDQGANAIALVGRRPPAKHVERQLAALRARGARIEVIRGDVGRIDDVVAILERLRQECPPLRGIFHAAMVLEDRRVEELDAASLERVMAPKALGAWNLHQATQRESLDLFVMFSSIASLLGNPFQANYGAASTFLDELAHHRRARGLPALTVNWGVLSHIGYVAERQELGDYLGRQGYLSFSPRQAFDALDALLRRDATQIMAARIDWAVLSEFSSRAAASPRIRALVPAERQTQTAGHTRSAILARLAEADDADRLPLLADALAAIVGRVLGLGAAGIDRDVALDAMGLDSLLAVELITLVGTEFGVELSVVTMLDGMTVERLAALLLSRIDFAVVSTVLGEAGERGLVAPSTAHSRTAAALPPAPIVQSANPSLSAIPLPSAPTPQIAAVVSQVTDADEREYAALDYARWSPRQRMVRAICRTVIAALAKVDVEGLENVPAGGPCIIAVNHLSMADVPLALTLLSRRTIILATDKLKRSRFLDWFLSDLGDAIYVRRNDDSTEALARALAVLKAGGVIALSPEGTRSREGLIRGRTGIAYLATAAGVPVIPFVAWGQERWRWRLRQVRRLPTQVRVGPPIYFPPGTAPPQKLREYTDRIMVELARMLPHSYRGVYAAAAAEAESRQPLVAE
jgi:1-acyl-sn-glycerol-3-phosphate acyltransferase